MADGENVARPGGGAPPPGGGPAPRRSGPSRRAFLLGGGAAALAGAGVGVGVEFGRDHPGPASPPPRPAVLLAALAAERALIATLDASLPGAGANRATLRAIRSDHAAHERALAAAVVQAGRPDLAHPGSSGSAGPSAASPAPRPANAATLRRAEVVAARRAAQRAGRLRGRDATLLACIAASEAGHAELLS